MTKLLFLKFPAGFLFTGAPILLLGFAFFVDWKIFNSGLQPTELHQALIAFWTTVFSTAGTTLAAFIGAIVVAYWSADSVYGRKWAEVVQRYYAIQDKYDADSDADNSEEISYPDFQYCQLCVDILSLGLWADPTLMFGFKAFVLEALKRSARSEAEKGVMRQKLLDGEARSKDVYLLLSQYQDMYQAQEDARGPGKRPRRPRDKPASLRRSN